MNEWKYKIKIPYTLGDNIICTAFEKFYIWYLGNAISCQITCLAGMHTDWEYLYILLFSIRLSQQGTNTWGKTLEPWTFLHAAAHGIQIGCVGLVPSSCPFSNYDLSITRFHLQTAIDKCYW